MKPIHIVTASAADPINALGGIQHNVNAFFGPLNFTFKQLTLFSERVPVIINGREPTVSWTAVMVLEADTLEDLQNVLNPEGGPGAMTVVK